MHWTCLVLFFVIIFKVNSTNALRCYSCKDYRVHQSTDSVKNKLDFNDSSILGFPSLNLDREPPCETPEPEPCRIGKSNICFSLIDKRARKVLQKGCQNKKNITSKGYEVKCQPSKEETHKNLTICFCDKPLCNGSKGLFRDIGRSLWPLTLALIVSSLNIIQI